MSWLKSLALVVFVWAFLLVALYLVAVYTWPFLLVALEVALVAWLLKRKKRRGHRCLFTALKATPRSAGPLYSYRHSRTAAVAPSVSAIRRHTPPRPRRSRRSSGGALPDALPWPLSLRPP